MSDTPEPSWEDEFLRDDKGQLLNWTANGILVLANRMDAPINIGKSDPIELQVWFQHEYRLNFTTQQLDDMVAYIKRKHRVRGVSY